MRFGERSAYFYNDKKQICYVRKTQSYLILKLVVYCFNHCDLTL
jgi:hypothetical protein